MASSSLEPRPETRESGFATPAAAAISVAIALMATAITTAAISELKLTHADLIRTQAQYALDGAQVRAALSVMSATTSGRLLWTSTGAAEVLAEPEGGKLDLAHAAQLDDATLAKLGVTDPARLQARLAELGEDADSAAITEADASTTWRTCARSIISPFGGPSLRFLSASTPGGSSQQWRVGEVWRIRATLAEGWVDDRIVRFTGDANRPVVTIERQFGRGVQEGNRCNAIFTAS